MDFEKRKIRVDHQLVRTREGKCYIEKTKTECGCRFIPMSDEVYQSFYNILSHRKKQKKEIMIDGYAGFILLDQRGQPKAAMHLEKVVQRMWEKYNKNNVIPASENHTPCIPSYLLHEYGKRRYGYQKSAILNGTRRCQRNDERVHP